MDLTGMFPHRHALRKEIAHGPLGPYMDGFIESVSQVGYTPGSLKALVQGAIYFGRYLAAIRLTDVSRLTDRHVQDFIASTPIRLAHGKYPMHVSPAARAAPHVMRYLRQIHVASPPTPPPEACFPPLLEEWSGYLRHQRGLSEGSIGLYRRQIARFLHALGPDATAARLKGVTTERIRSYLSTAGSAFGRAHRKAMTSTVRLFLGYAWDRGYLKKDLRLAVERIPAFKYEQLPRGPRWDDAVSLLETPDRSTAQGQRDYAILLILITYGVRAFQVAGLTVDDLDWRAMKLQFQAAKGGRRIEVPLTRPVGEAIVEYLRKGRPQIACRRLFLTLHAPVRPLAAGSVDNVVCRAFHAAGVTSPHRGAHALPHAWATRMLAAGRSLKVIADLLGHRQLDTTRIYAKVDFAQLREAALAWPEGGSR
jgi:integrase/recombinase XerD